MSKRIKFFPPIDLPNGAKLFTLEDAGRYIMKLPARQRAKPEWEFAGRQVVAAINKQSFPDFARLAMTRALDGIKPGEMPPAPPRDASKDRFHEFRNYKKRDPWR